MKFPFMVIYKDPQKNWDNIAKDHLIEEIKKDGFDNFTALEWKKAALFLGMSTPEKKAKKKKRGKKV